MNRSELLALAAPLQQKQQTYIEALLSGRTDECRRLGEQFQTMGRLLTDELNDFIEGYLRQQGVDYLMWSLGQAQRDERLALVRTNAAGEPQERLFILGVQRQKGVWCWLTNRSVCLPVVFGPELHPLVVRPGMEDSRYLYHTGTLLGMYEALLNQML